ncbi:MAG: DNA repair exonuclease [Ruminococcus sp.]|nr:DNA repair exonuclease [Ruminococcus sp.]
MNNKIKILHCSDLHIGAELSFLKNKSKSRRAEVLNTLNRITMMCLQQGIELLIIAGDLFDSNHIDSQTLTAVKSMFAAIPDTIVAIVAGNHDYFAVDSPYSDDDWSPNVSIFFKKFSTIEFPKKNLRLCGSSFLGSYQESSGSELNVPDDDMINILIYHGDLVTNNQSSKYNPVTINELENSRFDYVALGHIHSATPLAKAGNTTYAYSGTPDGNGFDETGKKGVYTGYVYKHRTELAFFPTSSRLYENVSFDITSLTSNSGIAKSIINKLETLYGAEYQDNLYKITLTGKTPEGFLPSRKSITTELQDTLYYVSVINQSTPDTDIKILSSDFSLKGIFVKKMLAKINACENEAEKEMHEKALYIGLKAFDREVSFYEN